MNIKKIIKIFLGLYLILFLITIGCVVIAAGDSLEVEYPDFPNIETPTKHPVFLPDYIRYLYQFAVAIGGLIAFITLIIGGFRYLISAGNPGTMSDARNQMLMGILGLIVILGSYVVLNEINPDLLSLRPPGLTPLTGKSVILYTDNDCGGGSNGQPGILFPMPEGTEYTKIKGSQSINSFDIYSFWTSDAAPYLTEVSFFPNSDCSGNPPLGNTFTPQKANDCISTGGLSKIQCVKLTWHIPGVWLFNYKGGDSENPDSTKGNFDIFQLDQAGLPSGLRENVKSIALVPDEKGQTHYGVILHNGTGPRSERKGWAQLYLPSGSNIFTVNTKNTDAGSITVFRTDASAPDREVTICENVDCGCQPDKQGICQDASITYGWEDMQEVPGMPKDIVRAIVLKENNSAYRWWTNGHEIAVCSGYGNVNWIGWITWRTGGCFRGISSIKFEAGAQYLAVLYERGNGILAPDGRNNDQALVIDGSVRNLGEYNFNEKTGIIYIIKIRR